MGNTKKIEDGRARQTSFSNRSGSLLKKARELAVLCDAEIGVFVFSEYGKLHEFSSVSNMKETLSRYQKFPKRQEPTNAVDTLKEQVSTLKTKQSQLLGNDLTCLSLKDLKDLEDELAEGLCSVKKRKMNLFNQHIMHSQQQGQQAMFACQMLQKRVEQQQDLLQSSEPSFHYFLDSTSLAKKFPSDCTMEEDRVSGPDTTLQLGLPQHKGKS